MAASAINQLEMREPETFRPETIDRELGWSQTLSMNTACITVIGVSGSLLPCSGSGRGLLDQTLGHLVRRR
jgi:hypothetical protein